MKKYFILSLVLAFLVLQLSAQTVWTSIASGNWSAASTWVRTGSGGGTAATPPSSLGNNQRVVITGGFTVTQSNDITLDGSARLTIQNGGRLNMGNDKNLSQKNDNNQFIINNGTYENNSAGNGGNMLIEKGSVNWFNASVYV